MPAAPGRRRPSGACSRRARSPPLRGRAIAVGVIGVASAPTERVQTVHASRTRASQLARRARPPSMPSTRATAAPWLAPPWLPSLRSEVPMRARAVRCCRRSAIRPRAIHADRVASGSARLLESSAGSRILQGNCSRAPPTHVTLLQLALAWHHSGQHCNALARCGRRRNQIVTTSAVAERPTPPWR